MAVHSQDVLAALDPLQIARFQLLGHAMGGRVLQEIVCIAPQRDLLNTPTPAAPGSLF